MFLICPDHWEGYVLDEGLLESIVEKLASIPDHGKLVVSPPGWRSISSIPETLHVILDQTRVPYSRRRAGGDSRHFTSFIEILKKRWSSLDLISIMKEFKRTWPNCSKVKDNLSTLPRF